ncbi:MAG: hypothetical protein JNK82_20085 [Myxococcaceae bacterium]|nr:hypothetical protein [Myxococcaceae bacterium]
MKGDAHESAAAAAGRSYGRLVALLASRTRDIAGAEDALAEAFAAALATWPTRGVPENPDAWLLTVARRTAAHGERHRRVRSGTVDELLRRADERRDLADGAPLDERLKLLFVCAHPAIDVGVRTPLMLQTVLGLSAERIASAFLVSPATMGQRLVRAKVKIKEAGLEFEVPEAAELPARLDDVLQAVYAAFGAGWDDLDAGRGLTDEALFLGRTLVELAPAEPEPKGLLALMLYCDSRRAARRDADGRFVPLPQQDPRRWNPALVVEAEGLLTEASRAARFGRFQCEATAAARRPPCASRSGSPKTRPCGAFCATGSAIERRSGASRPQSGTCRFWRGRRRGAARRGRDRRRLGLALDDAATTIQLLLYY